MFHGRKIGKELVEILKSFTISILSSINEGTPNIILESMAMGTPVISNPSGGVPELVDDGTTGYLFPYNRSDILAEKIIYLIENKPVAAEMTRAARRIVELKFNYNILCSLYIDLILRPR